MKPMVYKSNRDRWFGKYRFSDTLAHGIYNGFQYWIMNLGSHPTAYVEIPKGHRYFGCHYDKVPVVCHYGLTYSEDHLIFHEYSPKYKCDVKTRITDTWIVGWDYAHSGDYYASFLGSIGGRKYKTEEIFDEVKQVINQLKELETDE